MEYKGFVLELMVKNVSESVDFYTDILGFELVADEKENGMTYWAQLRLSDFILSLKEEDRIKKEVEFMKDRKAGGGAIICIQLREIEEFYTQLEEKCRVLNHPHLTPCGATEFSMQDNNGYVITFEKYT